MTEARVNNLPKEVTQQEDSQAGFPLLKNSRLFRDPQNVFPGLFRSPAMLNYRQTAVTYSVYTL